MNGRILVGKNTADELGDSEADSRTLCIRADQTSPLAALASHTLLRNPLVTSLCNFFVDCLCDSSHVVDQVLGQQPSFNTSCQLLCDMMTRSLAPIVHRPRQTHSDILRHVDARVTSSATHILLNLLFAEAVPLKPGLRMLFGSLGNPVFPFVPCVRVLLILITPVLGLFSQRRALHSGLGSMKHRFFSARGARGPWLHWSLESLLSSPSPLSSLLSSHLRVIRICLLQWLGSAFVHRCHGTFAVAPNWGVPVFMHKDTIFCPFWGIGPTRNSGNRPRTNNNDNHNHNIQNHDSSSNRIGPLPDMAELLGRLGDVGALPDMGAATALDFRGFDSES